MTEQHPAVEGGRTAVPVAMTAAAESAPSDSTAATAVAVPAPPSMTLWGRRAALWYLLVGALALVAMLVETVLGHPGTGTMFAAILAAPWSMLVAGMAPALPRDWPMAAGLAVRMVPLLLFMLLNALIVASIAARSERDLKGGTPRALLLLVLAGMLSSGCGLRSRQVLLVAAPVRTSEFFNGGGGIAVLEFDLTQLPQWRDHAGRIRDVQELSLMGEFANPLDGPFVPVVAGDIEIAMSPTYTFQGTENVFWWELHLEPGQSHRVDWAEGAAKLHKPGQLLAELTGDGQFTILVRVFSQQPNASTFVSVKNFRLGAVLQVK